MKRAFLAVLLPIMGGGEAYGKHSEGAAQAKSCRCGQAKGMDDRWQGDVELGEGEDAVILKTFGDVPNDFRLMT